LIRASLIVLAAASGWVAPAAVAQDRGQVAIVVRPQPLRDAVIDLGLQLGVSIDAAGAERCGRSRGARGTMTAAQAFALVTYGTGCAVVGDVRGAFRITRIVTARPATRTVAPSLPRSPDFPPTMLDEVVVTATRSEDVLLSQAPYGLSSLDGRDLEHNGVSDLAGIASRVSGLTVTNLGPGRDKVFIRGLADGPVSGQAQALVGLYLDDVRLTYDAPDPALRLADLDRIEVLRGPQGALYGAGSMGGVLQLVTRRPDATALSGRIAVEGTLTSGGAPGQAVEAMINLPVVADRFAVRAIGYDERVGGYVDDPALGLSDNGGVRRSGLRVSAAWTPSSDWTLRAGWLAQTIQGDDSQYAAGGMGAYARRRALVEPNRNDFDGVWLGLDADLGWARLKASSSLQSHSLDVRYDATPAGADFGLTGVLAFDQGDDLSAAVHEVRLDGEAGERIDWRAGVFFSEYTHDQRLDLGPPGGVAALERVRRDHTDEIAVFGDATFAVTDTLGITAGARLLRLGVEHRSLDEDGVPFEGETVVIGLAPRAVITWRLDPLLLYAQVSEGYRGAGFNAGRLGVGQQPDREAPSDELVAWEIGARFDLFDGHLRGRVAGFLADWSDIQSDRFDARGLPFTANLGDGRNTGLEGEFSLTLSRWTIDGHAVVNDPELTKPNAGFALAADGRLPSVADVAAGTGLQRRFVFGPVAASAELRVTYVGPTALALSPAISSRSPGVLSSEFGVTAEVGRWTVRGSVENLLNRAGDTFSFGNPFYAADGVTTPQRPLTARFSLAARF
jgi:outer membrane receptor protein involved in Fe transport